MRYFLTAAVAALLLAVALKSRGAAEPAPTTDDAKLIRCRPEVDVVSRNDGGRDLTVRLRYAGSVTRARLVYELDGERHTAHETSDCTRSLQSGTGVEHDGYTTEVELKGVIPDGASDVQVLVESETGTGYTPVEIS